MANPMASVVGQVAGIHLLYTGGNIVGGVGVSYITERWASRRDEMNTSALSEDTCEFKAILSPFTCYTILLQILMMMRDVTFSQTLMTMRMSLWYWQPLVSSRLF